MIIKPMIRNNICLNSHPQGCARFVENEIKTVKNTLHGAKPAGSPKLVLVIGCSTGYGLSSRIVAAFGYGAATVGLSFEKPGTPTKCGTPGFYNNLAFDRAAHNEKCASATINADAFSEEAKLSVIEAVKKTAAEAGIEPKIDLVVYSLASPVRTDPKTGVMYRSVIKPIGEDFSGETIDPLTGERNVVSVERATEEEIAGTIKVMGGEDWELWIDALQTAKVLAPSFRTVAYTYIGPKLSWAIYKNGTIGRAKEDLERAVKEINRRHGSPCAWVSVNKAVVTRASAVIPIIPLYISCLFRVMKSQKVHEGCTGQIIRLFRDRLYTEETAACGAKIPVDEAGRIRLDELEMSEEIQKLTNDSMQRGQTGSIEDYRHDFLEAHGFDVEGIDYSQDVATDNIDRI